MPAREDQATANVAVLIRSGQRKAIAIRRLIAIVSVLGACTTPLQAGTRERFTRGEVAVAVVRPPEDVRVVQRPGLAGELATDLLGLMVIPFGVALSESSEAELVAHFGVVDPAWRVRSSFEVLVRESTGAEFRNMQGPFPEDKDGSLGTALLLAFRTTNLYVMPGSPGPVMYLAAEVRLTDLANRKLLWHARCRNMPPKPAEAPAAAAISLAEACARRLASEFATSPP